MTAITVTAAAAFFVWLLHREYQQPPVEPPYDWEADLGFLARLHPRQQKGTP